MTAECPTCRKLFETTEDDRALLAPLDLERLPECPRCTWRHLLAFWFFGRFRKAASALSGKSIITTLPETASFPIYGRDEWLSDAWDPMAYGREYDPARPFLDQLTELQRCVPHPHQTGTNNTRCEWSDDVDHSKDCYLCRSLLECEEVSYGYRIVRSKRSLDIVFCFDMERSYDCTYCFKCYGVRYAFNARDCIESAFLYDCRNVQHCFMCWNLRNKQYCILNQQYTKEEYLQKLSSFDLRSRSAVERMKREFAERVARDAVHRGSFNVQAVNSTGNFLEECKDCADCYFLQKSQNCRHIFRGFEDKDIIGCTGSMAEKAALSVLDWYAYDVVATSHCANCRYSAYLDYCEECEYCFGCIGLRKKKFCILNRQYGEVEYRATMKRIKDAMKQSGEWGRFFPYAMAYCGYNDSLAQIYFPASPEEARALGVRWDDLHEPPGEGMSADELPDRIDDAPDNLPTKQLFCPVMHRKFNIAPHELAFYREHGIPLPSRHFDYRTLEQLRPLTVTSPYPGSCTFCGEAIRHFYLPAWGYERIACVECYQKEIV